jgi:hypothetical protein
MCQREVARAITSEVSGLSRSRHDFRGAKQPRCESFGVWRHLETPSHPRALPKITEVMVLLTAKEGATRQQIMAVMPSEVRETVKLYLDGKIRQWYSRGDGKGAVLLIDAKTQEEARAVVETLPLSREQLMDHEYIPVGPLMPLMGLLGAGAR